MPVNGAPKVLALTATATAVVAASWWVRRHRRLARTTGWVVPYMEFTGGPPRWLVENPNGGQANEYQNMRFDVRTVAVSDGRMKHLRFNEHGVELVRMPTAVTDFYDDAQVAQVYDLEAEALLKTVTGCSRVIIFDHTRRTTSAELQEAAKTRTPAIWVHGDYSPESAKRRLLQAVPAEADALLQGRWAICNVWRSARGTVRRKPLVFMLNSSEAAQAGDVFEVARVSEHEGRTSSIAMARYSSSHEWITFPGMDVSEAAIFKTFDSTDPLGALLHTAADDPHTADDDPPRESIEVRALCFWKPAYS